MRIGMKIAIIRLIMNAKAKYVIPSLGKITRLPAVIKQWITYISNEYLPHNSKNLFRPNIIMFSNTNIVVTIQINAVRNFTG